MVPEPDALTAPGLRQLFSGRRGRKLRESLTAYLMLAPALTLIFTFGIFPVGFALYVSLHRWLIVRDEFRGIANYVDAVDNLAYVGLFAMAVGALIGAGLMLRTVTRQARSQQITPWLYAVPAAFYAAATLAFFRWSFFQLPEVLDIAAKMRGLERTRELFLRLLSEAFHAESVFPVWRQFVGLTLAAIAVGVLVSRLRRSPDSATHQANLTIVWLGAAIGLGLFALTFSEIGKIYAAAVESGEDPGIWPQLIVILSGLLLLAAAWTLWRSAAGELSNRSFAFRLFFAAVMMVGAVLLIVEIPTVVASGDPDLWNGLKVTAYFSLGTVPVQLTIALFLSVLLFQNVRGASAFRVIYFLPYVTPALASATIFRLLFSERQSAPANRVLEALGIGPQDWLRESDGILTMLARTLGVSDYPASILPNWFHEDLTSLLSNWLTGPSQALTVVIMLSIWTFVGYNVVIYLAGLGNIPAELTEAAEIDGASGWQVFRNITFPLLSPTTYFLSLIAVMGTFKAFNTIWLLRSSVGTGLGTLNTISIVIFEEFFVKTRYGYASALAFVLFVFILGLTFLNNRIQGSRVFYG